MYRVVYLLHTLKKIECTVQLLHKQLICVCIQFQGHFMYMSNLEEYGHLVNADDYSTEHLHNDLYEIENNIVVGNYLSVWCVVCGVVFLLCRIGRNDTFMLTIQKY